MPDGFIPIAESSDLILEIGDFVIRQGCADLRKQAQDRSEFRVRASRRPQRGRHVNATIALARGIGAKVLAEGPETDAQISFLRVHGCDIGQGFCFSRGIPLEELHELIDRGPFALTE